MSFVVLFRNACWEHRSYNNNGKCIAISVANMSPTLTEKQVPNLTTLIAIHVSILTTFIETNVSILTTLIATKILILTTLISTQI